MKLKNVVLASLIMLAILTIGTVSASDSILNESCSSDEIGEVEITSHVDDVKEISGNDDMLASGDCDEGSGGGDVMSNPDDDGFGALQMLIDNASDEITLEHDYYGNGSEITISKAITINGDGHTLDAKGLSRIFNVQAANVCIKNMMLINAKADSKSGGAVYWSGASGRMLGCDFVLCSAREGGAVYVSGANLLIQGCVFDSNKATADRSGGALWIIGNGVVVDGCRFNNNTGSNRGGVIVLSNSKKCTISNSVFTNNQASKEGGVIYRYYETYGYVYSSLVNCTFVNSSSNDRGGAVYWDSGNGDFVNCTFVNSSSSKEGGAIYWYGGNSAKCNVVNSTFVNSNSKVSGGDVYWYQGSGNVVNSTFVNSTSSGQGASMYWNSAGGSVVNSTFMNIHGQFGSSLFTNGNSVTLTNVSVKTLEDSDFNYVVNNTIVLTRDYVFDNTMSLIQDNLVLDGNGHTICAGSIQAFYVSAKNVTIKNLIIENTSSSNRGVVYWTGASGSLVNCSFVNCTSSGSAGAVFWAGGNGRMLGCDFVLCSAREGGAVYVSGANLLIQGCVFDSNKATADRSGGALWIIGNGVVVDGCRFNNNTGSNRGGVIVLSNSKKCTISNSVFTNNQASKEGGVIYRYYETYGYVYSSLVNCTFVNSSSNDRGGAVYWDSGNGDFVNCTFVNSSASKEGGAIYWNGGNNAKCNVVNSTFINSNSKSSGGAIYSNSGVNVNIQNSTFINNSASSNGNAIYNCEYDGNCIFENNSLKGIFFEQNYRKKTPIVVNITEAECLILNISMPERINATISLSGENKSFTVDIIRGKGIVYIDDFEVGNYTFKLEFAGSDEFVKNTTYVGFITKMPLNLTMNVNVTYVGDVAVFSITGPDDFNGTLVLSIDKNTYSVDMVNGIAEKRISNLGAGNHNAFIRFEGDVFHYQATSSVDFNVSKVSSSVNVGLNTDNGIVTLTSPTGGSDVIFTLDNKTYPVVAGKVDLKQLNAGTYNYSVYYPGNYKYDSFNDTGSLTLTKNMPSVAVQVNDFKYAEKQIVTVTVPDNAQNEVNFILSKNDNLISNVTAPVVDGIAEYELPTLDLGTYNLKACYKGDSNYYQTSFYEKTFKVNPSIDISPEVQIEDDGKIVIGVGNSTGRIYVTVDGEDFGNNRISRGYFTHTLATDELSVGYHNLSFRYDGNSFDPNVFNELDNQTGQYVQANYTIYITKKHTVSDTKSDSDNEYSVILVSTKGKVLENATGTVEFVVMDEFGDIVERLVVEIVKGIATLDISKYKNGNYLIMWSYSGDGKHDAISNQVRMTIDHRVSKIDDKNEVSRIAAGDIAMVYTSSKVYSVIVYGASGKPLAGARVNFLINGKSVGSALSNANGVASILVAPAPGSYLITAISSGADVSKKLTVSHLLSLNTVKVKKSAKKIVIKATLKKVNGKFLKNKRIVFKFNGKKYSAKTDKKGVAKIIVKKAVLKKLKVGKKVTYQATYLKDTVKKTVKIKK